MSPLVQCLFVVPSPRAGSIGSSSMVACVLLAFAPTLAFTPTRHLTRLSPPRMTATLDEKRVDSTDKRVSDQQAHPCAWGMSMACARAEALPTRAHTNSSYTRPAHAWRVPCANMGSCLALALARYG